MKQKKIKFFLLAGVITLVGCVMSSCTEEVLEKTASNRIIFSVYDQGFNESKVQTRGAKVNSITSFGVSASVYSAAASYTSAGCGSYFYNESATAGLPTDFFWPTSSYKVSFFAHYPFNNAAFTVQSASSALGAPTYAYTVPSAIGSQLDIMTGQNVNILGGGSSPVALTMKHRCAAICFSVTNSRSSAVTLNSISIEGVKYSGTLNEDTWTLTSAVNSSSSNPFTLSYGSSIAAGATVDVTGTTNIFLMLPQTIPAGAKLKVAIDGEDPLYADLTGSWVASKQYNYSLDIQNSTIIIVDEDTEIEDWVKPVIIDLGLPSGTKWARGNIVSDGNGDYKIGTETDYGAYFSWGNITPHFSANGSTFDDSYNFGTSRNGPYASTPGNSVSADIPSNDATHDAALALLGSPWHLPTKENFQELYDNTDREWTTSNGVGGWKFMKKTDHSLYVFFPAAGRGSGTSLNERGSYGYYWSSSWNSTISEVCLYFYSSSVSPLYYIGRYFGFSVRPVAEE